MIKLHDQASASRKNLVLVLPSLGERSVSARNGKFKNSIVAHWPRCEPSAQSYSVELLRAFSKRADRIFYFFSVLGSSPNSLT